MYERIYRITKTLTDVNGIAVMNTKLKKNARLFNTD